MGQSVSMPVMSTSAANEVKAKTKYDIHLGDRIFQIGLKVMAWGVVFLLLAMVIMILRMSWPALEKFGIGFFFSKEWDSVKGEYGALAMIYGTVVTSFLALLLAVPTGIGVALFLQELAPPWLGRPIGFFVEMLAAVPSIVYGLWGVFVLSPWLRDYIQTPLAEKFAWFPLFSGPPMGLGLMAAGFVLAIMIVPTIAALSREVFRAIPNSYREAALGIGATRWECLKVAVLKTATPGLVAAVILGLGRALGETMAVTMVVGNRVEILTSLFAPGQTLASILANQYAEADSDLHLSALTAVGLSLFILSLLINGLARAIVWRLRHNLKGAK